MHTAHALPSRLLWHFARLPALLVAGALFFAPTAARSAAPGPPGPEQIDPCVVDPASCPPEVDLPPLDLPPLQDPFEPLFVGFYKMKVPGAVKHEGPEAFEPGLLQFPDVVLETAEGFELPLQLVVDPVKGKMKVVFTALSTPIVEAWLTKRLADATGQTASVSLSEIPRIRVREKKSKGYQLVRIRAKGTATIDGETRSFRYVGVVAAFGLGS